MVTHSKWYRYLTYTVSLLLFLMILSHPGLSNANYIAPTSKQPPLTTIYNDGYAPADVTKIHATQMRNNLTNTMDIGQNDFLVSHRTAADPTYDAMEPAIAYNSRANEYLVVWEDRYSSPDGNTSEGDIYGQRLSATGEELGSNDFPISVDSTYDAAAPAIVYNSQADEYLVVWYAIHADTLETEIYGQRLTATGQEIGLNDFRISDMGPEGNGDYHGHSHALTYHSAANEYLVVWSGDDTIEGRQDIYGQRLSATGAEIGSNDFRISDLGDGDTDYDAFFPALTYNTTTDEYLVVWTKNTDGAGKWDIQGQRLTATGAEVGPDDFRISETSDAYNATVTYNSIADEYLVVWQGRYPLIYGQRLNATTGQELGSNDFNIGNTAYRAAEPTVTYNPIANEYLLAWHSNNTAAGRNEIHGQRLTVTGAGIDPNDFRISDMAYDASSSMVIYNDQAHEYLVVWTGEDSGLDNSDIYGQRLALEPQWLVLLYVGADDMLPDQTGRLRTSLGEEVGNLQTRLNQMPYNPAMQLVILVDGPNTNDSAVYERTPTGLISVHDKIAASDAWYGQNPSDGDLDTGSTVTLQNFLRWSQQEYPDIPHTFLAMIDHGGGWAPDFGKGVQPPALIAFQTGGWRGMSFDARSDTSFSTRDTSEALEALGSLGEIDVLFLDACLMGMVESVYEVRDYAEYVIAGENLLWAQFSYNEYLSRDALTYTTTPRDLATSIVAQYNQPASPLAPFTIAAIDTDRLPAVKTTVENLATALLTEWDTTQDPTTIETAIRTAYQQTQKFDYDSNLQLDPTDGYIDLAHFAQMLRRQDVSAAINTAADAVNEAVAAAVIAEQTVSGTPLRGDAPWDFTNANGLSIYLPLGERDCRPTGQINGTTDPSCMLDNGANDTRPGEPAVENQLNYYTLEGQLQFTSNESAWAALLTRLDTTTPIRNLTQHPFASPFHMESWQRVYLPLLE